MQKRLAAEEWCKNARVQIKQPTLFSDHREPGFSQQVFGGLCGSRGWRQSEGSCQGQGQSCLCFVQQEVELQLQGGLSLLAWGSAWSLRWGGWITDCVLICGQVWGDKAPGSLTQEPKCLLTDRLSKTNPELHQEERWRGETKNRLMQELRAGSYDLFWES